MKIRPFIIAYGVLVVGIGAALVLSGQLYGGLDGIGGGLFITLIGLAVREPKDSA